MSCDSLLSLMYVNYRFLPFLANVNSRSRSLYVVVHPSVCLSVCLSETFVHPTQAIEIFGNISTPFGTLVIQVKFYGDCPRGTPPSGELNTRGVAEYSDFGPIERYLGNGARQELRLY